MTVSTKILVALGYFYPCRSRLTAEACTDLGKPQVEHVVRRGLLRRERLGGGSNATTLTITNAGTSLSGHPRFRGYGPVGLRTSLLIGHVAHKTGWRITDGSDTDIELPQNLIYLHDKTRNIIYRPLCPALTASVESAGKTVLNLFDRLAENCGTAINAGRVRGLVVLSHGPLVAHKAEKVKQLSSSRSELIAAAMVALNVETFTSELAI
jgi:hypothetical protein